MKLRLLSSYVLLLLVLNACQKPDDNATATCQPPTALTALGPCESGIGTTLLVASGFTDAPNSQFVFQLYPQSDTLSADVSIKRNKWGTVSANRERTFVLDSVLRTAPKFFVKLTMTCNGIPLATSAFAFIKRPARADDYENCYRWIPQKL
ncbi:hypothetical protein [Spirosoma montaniterrae]|uniref:Lipoprotein n=1 Tax=Spirosoma montaniterrae TaxID=1178516 RepID=A0A1P9WVP5_9BACT|nr:hypothetical protein [Spirosoma montaniterrae]AQG79398.1 hypothetical protein AWR27_08745 [Spirosoma montaniterrae]